jgi:uncharacterized membrane protein affecting hemolysin expression
MKPMDLFFSKNSVRVFFVLCFVACLFTNVAYAQTNKTKTSAEQREEILAQLEQQTAAFLATLDAKREQNLEKKQA